MENGYRLLSEQDISTVSTTQLVEYGARGVTSDGRNFVYVGFGGTATINPGNLVVTPAAPSNSTGLAIPTTNSSAQLSAGSTSLIVTNGTTAVTADQFAGGYLELITGTDGPYSLEIAGNTAAGNGGAITLALKDPIPAGATKLVAGTDTANLRLSPFNGVRTTLTAAVAVGVTTCVVPNTATVTNYGWVQTSGLAFVNATTATAGQAITQDTGGTAGFVMNVAAATSKAIGTAYASASGSKASVYLNISA